MISRITHRHFRVEYIRKKPQYKIMKHLLFYINNKSLFELLTRVYYYKYKAMRLTKSVLKNREIQKLLDDIIEADFRLQILFAISDYLWGNNTYFDKILLQLGNDELPREAFLFTI